MLNKPALVILCGGKGTRLREQTEFMPKPLVRVGSMPILWHIMKYYSEYGVKKFILCLGYKGEMIKRFFLEYSWNHSDVTLNFKDGLISGASKLDDWEIIFAETGAEAMSGARMKRIEKYIDTDNFFMTYGDGVADVDIDKLYKFHLDHKVIATVTTVRPKVRFGFLDLAEDKVKSFEKKQITNKGWIDGGFFVFKKELFHYLKDQDNCELESDILPVLAGMNNFRAFKHYDFWQSMDTQKDVDILNDLVKTNKADWMIWEK